MPRLTHLSPVAVALGLLLAVGGCDVVETLNPQPDLRLTMSANTAPASEEAFAVATFTLANVGDAAATSVEVQTVIPDGIDSFGFPDSNARCPSFNSCSPGQILAWSFERLEPGESETIRFRVMPETSASPVFAATVDAEGLSTKRESLTIPVDQSPSLRLVVGASPARAAPGTTVRVEAAYTNASGSPYTNGEVTLTLPAGMTIASAGTGSVQGQTVTWSTGPMANQASARYEVLASIGSSREPGDALLVEARVQAGTGYDERAAFPVTVVSQTPRIKVSFEADTAVLINGRPTVMTFRAQNTSARDADDVVVNLEKSVGIARFSLPATMTCSFSGAQGCGRLSTLRWSVGRVSAGQTVEVNVPITPEPYTSGGFDGPISFYTFTTSAGDEVAVDFRSFATRF